MKLTLRILTLLLALLLLVGCNANTPDESDEATEEPTAAPTEAPTEAPDDRPADIVYSADLASYTVIVDDSASGTLKTMAGNLTDMLNERWNVSVILQNDENLAPAKYEILIGNTNRSETESFKASLDDGECGYTVVGRKIVILGQTDADTEKAINLFVNRVLLVEDTKSTKYLQKGEEFTENVSDMITVMSYNIRVGNSDNNPGTVTAMIKNYMPDLLGVQEADSGWMSVLKNRLSKSGYACVGLGRDADDTGERSAIFYRTDKFELLKTATYWLTDTPDVVSRVETSLCNRIVTIATFKRISDGKVFTHANTHLDHSGSTAREPQVHYLDGLVSGFTDESFILTGDFNFQPDNNVYAVMMKKGYLNCGQLAEYARGRENATYTGGSMIDYCFTFEGSDFYPYFYAVCDEPVNGGTPSDHHPIFLMLELPSKQAGIAET